MVIPEVIKDFFVVKYVHEDNKGSGVRTFQSEYKMMEFVAMLPENTSYIISRYVETVISHNVKKTA